VLIPKSSVTILGAGHGGLALAGYLARQGHRVALWSRSPGRIFPIAAVGGIELGLPGSATDFTALAVATCSLPAALAGSSRIVVAVPASGHADVARKCAPHLRDGQAVLLLPGRTGGALEFRQVLQHHGCRARILLGEANTFPFASRCVGPNAAVIHGAKADVQVAALPSRRTPELMAAWRPLLPMLAAAPSVLHTGLANLGAILHPAITLLNAERITRGDSFGFYADGVTADVAETLAAADAERLRIANRYGVSVPSLTEWLATAYGHRAASIQEAVGGNPAYAGIKAPHTLEHRYLLEDVPTGLIPLIELGSAAGLEVPTLRGLAERAHVLRGGQPFPQARTLAALGLAGLGIEQIRDHIERELVPSDRRMVRTLPLPAGRVAKNWPWFQQTEVRSASA
jgi:opine dehydrogenase